MKLIITSKVLKEQLAKIRAGVEAVFPSVFAVVTVAAKDIDVSALTPDEHGRYEIQLDAENKVRAGFFRGTPKDSGVYDVAFCKTVRDFTIKNAQGQEQTFEAGKWHAYKLVAAE